MNAVRRIGTAALCGLLAMAWAVPVTAARKARAPTLADLARRSAPVDRSQAVTADAPQAARSYEAFLAIEGADPALRAQALRRLGDLRLESAGALAAGDEGSNSQSVAAAQEAVTAFQQLLDEYPDYAARDAVMYQLARAEEAAGRPDAALAVLDTLVASYPHGAHADEAQFRRGEAFFSARRYADADRAYAAVLLHGPASDFHEQALYKRAWAQFKLGDNPASSATFLELLDRLLVADGRLRPDDQLTRPEQELAADTLRALSLMFAAESGADSLQAALAGRGAAPYESRLYRALGDLYVEKERYQDGAEAYRAFARRQPFDPEAPLLLGAATDAYAKAGFTSLVLEAKRELVELYGPKSAFWARQGAAIDPRVSAAVQANLLDLARYHHALAQKDGNAQDRAAAVRWYREYLDGFDRTPEAPATRLLLADLLFEGTQYADAATEYELAAYSYPGAPEAGRAGYAALVAYDKAEARATLAERTQLRARAIESSLRFADAFPGSSETPGVLTRTCKVLFDGGDRERAESVAQRVLALGARADAEQQRVAWTVLAHTWFDSARYAQAEQAYAEVAARLPANDPQLAEITERRAASVYRQAEARQAAGDSAGAVQDFLRVASVAPASPVRAQAEFDAAALLLGMQQWTQAAEVLERFRRDHPTNPLVVDVDRKLAVAYLEAGEPARAAAEFERVAARSTETPEVRRTALWQAAELHVAARDPAAATRVYAAYVQQYPAPFVQALDARQALADLARDANDAAMRKRWLEDVIATDRAAGAARTDRSRFLAATATLELARPLDASARAIRLALPLDKTLGAKRRALEAALGAYGNAAEYGIADITTEATYAMADLYRDLGKALLESDRPQGLDADELEQYDLLLEEQAFPFEEKAIGLHERNARRTLDGIYDTWVRKSFADLAALKPGRYARVEVSDAPVPGPTSPPATAAALAAAAASYDVQRWAEAAEHLAVAIATDPLNAAALNRLAVAQRQCGRFADAKAAYERALTADATYADAERNLAVLLDLYLDDASAALPHYERYQALSQGADQEVTAWLVELKSRLATIARTAEAQQ